MKRDVGWLEANWLSWCDRKDLLDDLIRKSADFTVWLIRDVDTVAKRCVLAALFDKGEEGMIDGVLVGINYNDDDLDNLTYYRPELAGSPEKFFKILDKVEDPKKAR